MYQTGVVARLLFVREEEACTALIIGNRRNAWTKKEKSM